MGYLDGPTLRVINLVCFYVLQIQNVEFAHIFQFYGAGIASKCTFCPICPTPCNTTTKKNTARNSKTQMKASPSGQAGRRCDEGWRCSNAKSEK